MSWLWNSISTLQPPPCVSVCLDCYLQLIRSLKMCTVTYHFLYHRKELLIYQSSCTYGALYVMERICICISRPEDYFPCVAIDSVVSAFSQDLPEDLGGEALVPVHCSHWKLLSSPWSLACSLSGVGTEIRSAINSKWCNLQPWAGDLGQAFLIAQHHT